MSTLDYTRTIAIDPTTRGFAFAVLEGSERLVEWGLARVWGKSNHEWLARVEQLLERSKPRLLVVEKTIGSRRGPRAKRLIERTKKLALDHRIAVVSIERVYLKQVLGSAKNKWELAVTVAKWFPELTSRLPEKRGRWQSEDERIRIFEAVAFALVAIRDLEEAAA